MIYSRRLAMANLTANALALRTITTPSSQSEGANMVESRFGSWLSMSTVAERKGVGRWSMDQSIRLEKTVQNGQWLVNQLPAAGEI